MKPVTYAEAGVDIDKKQSAMGRVRALAESTHDDNVVGGIGGFGGLYAFPAGFREPLLVSSTDGVGTKLKVAIEVGRHDSVGEDIVSHCVNDILVQGARPMFFLDYIAVGRLDPEVIVELVSGVARGCRQAGCALIGGETAEMPDVYREGEYDLAGTIVGVVERDRLIDGALIEPGDLLVGLESSGLHTNGYSFARHVLFGLSGMHVSDIPEELGISVGEELLKPHLCYERALRDSIDARLVKGMAHITGGGFYENVPRMMPVGTGAVIERAAFRVPPVFNLIQRLGSVEEREMYRSFNMGVGMVVAVSPMHADQIIASSQKQGIDAAVIGSVVESDRQEVRLA